MTLDSARQLVVVDRVTKRFGDQVALEDVSMSVERGEVVAVVGPNGAGKSTLLSLVAGWSLPSEGTIVVGGSPAGSIEARRILSYAPDSPVFYGDLSVAEHVEFVAAMNGVTPEQFRGAELLERFALDKRAESFPAELSRGMRQKLSLVLALVRPAEVLLLDEPLANLDEASVGELLAVVGELRDSGMAVLLVSHQPVGRQVATRTVAIDDGVLVEATA